jgi:DNA-directed RNA polymerase specialized sigma24 family protein
MFPTDVINETHDGRLRAVWNHLYLFAAGLTRNNRTDLVQEALLELVISQRMPKAGETFDERFLAFARQTLKNKRIDIYRAFSAKKRAGTQRLGTHDPASNDTPVDEDVIMQEMLACIDKAVNALPPEMATVLNLKIAKHKDSAIERMVGIDRKRVRTLYAEATHRVFQSLKSPWESCNA